MELWGTCKRPKINGATGVNSAPLLIAGRGPPCSNHFLFGFLGNMAGFMVNEISQKPKSVGKIVVS